MNKKDNKLNIKSEVLPTNTLSLADKFQYNGNQGFNLVPRAVIVIAGTPCIPLSIDINFSDDLVSNVITATFQSDLLDISELYNKSNLSDKAFVCEIWIGYLDSRKQTSWVQDYEDYKKFLSNDELKNDLLENYKTKLFRTYIGVIKQFEFDFDFNGDHTILSIGDLSLILQEFEFEIVAKDQETSIENIVNLLNKNMDSFLLKFDKSVKEEKQILMGKVDKIKKDKESGEETVEEKEVKYNTEGKSYWDIIEEILEKANLMLEVDLTNFDILDKNKNKVEYFIKQRYSSDCTWILEREKHFNKCNLRSGKLGVGSNNRVMIEVRSLNTDDNEYESGSFPENLSTSKNPIGTRFYIYKTGNNKEKKELDLIAKDIALKFAKFDINGSIQLPNGLIGLLPQHNLIIVDFVKDKNRSLSSLAGDIELVSTDDKEQSSINFNVSNVTCNYTFGEGYSQKIDFNLDLNLNILDTKDGQMRGRNLFPKNDKTTKGANTLATKEFRPNLNNLPSPLKKIREQGGI